MDDHQAKCGKRDRDCLQPQQSVQMVAIKVEEKSHVFQKDDQTSANELNALQWVARHVPVSHEKCILGPGVLLAGDAQFVYTISPYDFFHTGSLSLFEYCEMQPKSCLREETARGLFQKITKGLAMLQRVHICHRNLNLESFILCRQPATTGSENIMAVEENEFDPASTPYCCTITHLGHAMLVPRDGKHQLVSSLQILHTGCNPQYVAPEIFDCHANKNGNTSLMSEGYSVDIWSAGMILLTMLLGNDVLFHAPVQEDSIFRVICTTGGLKRHVRMFEKKRNEVTGIIPPISEGVIDLLDKILCFDPLKRLSLSEIQDHPWLRDD